MKRWIVICVSFLMIVGLLPMTVYAGEQEMQIAYGEGAIRLEELPKSSSNSQTDKTAEQRIVKGLQNVQAKIDLTGCSLKTYDLKNTLIQIKYHHPELFYMGDAYEYSYDLRTYTVTELRMSYLYTATEIKPMKQFYNQEIQKIVNLVSSSWGTEYKVAFLHDYIAQNFVYDTSLTIYDAYNMLKYKTGVCMSYTLLLEELLNRLHIPSTVATTSDHVWNVVQVNGNWYHVDVTADDPISKLDMYGLAQHDALLKSDAALRKDSPHNHTEIWDTSYSCTDTRYDTYFWSGTNAPIQYLNGIWYYTDFSTDSKSSRLMGYNPKTGQKSIQMQLGIWKVQGSSYFYTSTYSGLNVYNGKLYLNTADTIYSFDPATGASKREWKPAEAGNLYGMRINGRRVYYRMAGKPDDDNGRTYYYEMPALLGDADLNGSIDASDALQILKFAVRLSIANEEQKTAADVDGNKVLDASDALLVLKKTVRLIPEFPVQR